MPRTRQCDYCGDDIEPGTGTMFVYTDGATDHFCSSKCEKNADLGREARDVEWTAAGQAAGGPSGEAQPAEATGEPADTAEATGEPADTADAGETVTASTAAAEAGSTDGGGESDRETVRDAEEPSGDAEEPSGDDETGANDDEAGADGGETGASDEAGADVEESGTDVEESGTDAEEAIAEDDRG